MLFGLIFVFAGNFFLELSSSIGKYEIEKKRESIYAMGFLSLIWGCIFFACLIVLRNEFQFNLASLPTFLLRTALEIFQVYISMKAVAVASRSTYSFIHIGTIPLLLFIDLMLIHVSMSGFQLIGMAAVFLALLLLFAHRGVDKKGMLFVVLSTVNAAATITLYKYDISHFNSVEAEQFVLLVILLVYLTVSAWVWHRERPWTLLKKPLLFAQSTTYGIGTVLDSFAYTFAPASTITVMKRVGSVFWSIFSGKVIFKEKSLALKLFCFALMTAGIILLVR
jgi:drug/metabolite transporter (DMT)-like permease